MPRWRPQRISTYQSNCQRLVFSRLRVLTCPLCPSCPPIVWQVWPVWQVWRYLCGREYIDEGWHNKKVQRCYCCFWRGWCCYVVTRATNLALSKSNLVFFSTRSMDGDAINMSTTSWCRQSERVIDHFSEASPVWPDWAIFWTSW